MVSDFGSGAGFLLTFFEAKNHFLTACAISGWGGAEPPRAEKQNDRKADLA